MRIGTIEEHALLMASMFRAVKYESIEDVYTSLDKKAKEAQIEKITGNLSNTFALI